MTEQEARERLADLRGRFRWTEFGYDEPKWLRALTGPLVSTIVDAILKRTYAGVIARELAQPTFISTLLPTRFGAYREVRK